MAPSPGPWFRPDEALTDVTDLVIHSGKSPPAEFVTLRMAV